MTIDDFRRQADRYIHPGGTDTGRELWNRTDLYLIIRRVMKVGFVLIGLAFVIGACFGALVAIVLTNLARS